jgi:cell division protein FtsZ
MPKPNPPINIKVISIGNRGCNVLERLDKLTEKGVELGAVSVAGKVFNRLRVENKIELPYSFDIEQNRNIEEMAKSVINEKQKEISKLINGTDIVFLVGNLGNKVSTIQTKEIARLFKKEGALVFFVGSTAFHFEGKARQKTVEEMKDILKKEVDALLVIDNEKVAKQKISAIDAFTQIDKIIADVIVVILDIVIEYGVINVDFADLKTIVKNSGEAFFNNSSGSKKEISAIVNNLFSKTNLVSQQDCLKKVLYIIYAGKDLLMDEVKQIGEKIHKKSGGQEKIIFGIVNNDEMKGKLKIVMIGS